MSGGTSSSLDFVGRATEWARVRAVVDDAAAGRAGALLVDGEAGVGKTRLVEEVVAGLGRAPGTHPGEDEDDPGLPGGRAGTVVLAGAALPLTSMTVPFLPVRSALRRAARGAVPLDAAVLTAGERATTSPLDFDAWLGDLCADHPVVLAVDDLHWADQSTLDLLTYVLAGPRDRRLAVLLTLRRGEVGEGHPLNRWLADVRRLPGFARLTVGPLDRLETELQIAGVLGRPPHQSLVDEVFDHTRGNCYLTRLAVSGLDPDARHLPGALPGDLETALLATWHRLSPPARHLTRVIAVGGVGVTSTTLADVVARAGDEQGEDRTDDVAGLESLLAEARRGGLLDLGPDGTYWFQHPLQAEALADHLARDERRRWHAAYAAHLEAAASGGADVELLAAVADHHDRAGQVESAYRWALTAADAARDGGGTSEAVRLMGRALRLRDRVEGAPESRLELLTRYREAAAAGGDHASELAAVEALLEERADDPACLAELIVARTHIGFMLGSGFIDSASLQPAVEAGARTPGSWQHALAVAELAHAGSWELDPDQPARADEALALAEACGDPRALTYAYTAKAMAMVLFREDWVEAAGWARRGQTAAARAGDWWAFGHATLWEANSTGNWCSRTYAELLARRRRELEAHRAPHPYVAWIASVEASGWIATGAVDTGARLLRLCLGSSPGSLVDVHTRILSARFAALQGRVAEAGAHLARAEEVFAILSGFKAFEFDAVRAEVRLAEGNPRAAVRAALSALDEPGATPTMSEWLLPLAARGLADLAEECRHDRDDPGPVLAELDDVTRRYPVDGPDGPAVVPDGFETTPYYTRQLTGFGAWYAAEVARARRADDEGAAWDRAATALGAASLPWEAAYAASRAGEAHLARGHADRPAATRALREAARLAAELGAAPVAARVASLARAARVDVSPVTAPTGTGGPSLPGLTRREREVLAHVVAGRTYAEIAEALVVSEKTVSSHISNLLRKAGAANRVELARIAAGGGQAPPRRR